MFKKGRKGRSEKATKAQEHRPPIKPAHAGFAKSIQKRETGADFHVSHERREKVTGGEKEKVGCMEI